MELGDLWPNTHCGFSLTYSRCYHLCHTLHPYNQYVSVDKPSVSRPTGLEMLHTVDCLFDFINVSELEKGWTQGYQGSWRTLVLCFLYLFLVLQAAVTLCTCELTFNPVTFDSVCTYTEQKQCPNLMHVFVLVCCYVKCLKHPTAFISERPAFVQNTRWCINLMMWGNI